MLRRAEGPGRQGLEAPREDQERLRRRAPVLDRAAEGEGPLVHDQPEQQLAQGDDREPLGRDPQAQHRPVRPRGARPRHGRHRRSRRRAHRRDRGLEVLRRDPQGRAHDSRDRVREQGSRPLRNRSRDVDERRGVRAYRARARTAQVQERRSRQLVRPRSLHVRVDAPRVVSLHAPGQREGRRGLRVERPCAEATRRRGVLAGARHPERRERDRRALARRVRHPPVPHVRVLRGAPVRDVQRPARLRPRDAGRSRGHPHHRPRGVVRDEGVPLLQGERLRGDGQLPPVVRIHVDREVRERDPRARHVSRPRREGLRPPHLRDHRLGVPLHEASPPAGQPRQSPERHAVGGRDVDSRSRRAYAGPERQRRREPAGPCADSRVCLADRHRRRRGNRSRPDLHRHQGPVRRRADVEGRGGDPRAAADAQGRGALQRPHLVPRQGVLRDVSPVHEQGERPEARPRRGPGCPRVCPAVREVRRHRGDTEGGPGPLRRGDVPRPSPRRRRQVPASRPDAPAHRGQPRRGRTQVRHPRHVPPQVRPEGRRPVLSARVPRRGEDRRGVVRDTGEQRHQARRARDDRH